MRIAQRRLCRIARAEEYRALIDDRRKLQRQHVDVAYPEQRREPMRPMRLPSCTPAGQQRFDRRGFTADVQQAAAACEGFRPGFHGMGDDSPRVHQARSRDSLLTNSRISAHWTPLNFNAKCREIAQSKSV